MNRFSHMFTLLAVSAGLYLAAKPARGAEDSLQRIESDGAKPPSIDELLLFFPSKHPAGNWTPNDLRFEDVWFTAEDQTRLHGWHCPCGNPRATILIAHGNAGNIASRSPWLIYVQSKAQVSTFMFDYRGYGRSEGIPTVSANEPKSFLAIPDADHNNWLTPEYLRRLDEFVSGVIRNAK